MKTSGAGLLIPAAFLVRQGRLNFVTNAATPTPTPSAPPSSNLNLTSALEVNDDTFFLVMNDDESIATSTDSDMANVDSQNETNTTSTTTTAPPTTTTNVTTSTAATDDSAFPLIPVDQQDWSNFSYVKSTKFCGPKVVGGFAIAVSSCSPLTVCGMNITGNHYGHSGNDCPDKNLMCYSDITCRNGPGNSSDFNAITNDINSSVTNTTATTTSTTTSSVEVVTPAVTPTTDPSTNAPTATESIPPSTIFPFTSSSTISPNYNPFFGTITITSRGSFCGSFYAEAVSNCGLETMCSSSSDCSAQEECFSDISCTLNSNNSSSIVNVGNSTTTANTTSSSEFDMVGDDLFSIGFIPPIQDDAVSFLQKVDVTSAAASTMSNAGVSQTSLFASSRVTDTSTLSFLGMLLQDWRMKLMLHGIVVGMTVGFP